MLIIILSYTMLYHSDLKQPTCFHRYKLIVISLLGLFFLLGQLVAFGQTTYYIATTGNDLNNGKTSSTPFQSLSQATGLSLQPGDSVLFRRGDTFRGTLTIRQSGSASKPIVFDAYGSGPKPVLAGSVPVNNWTNTGNNVWQASCPSCGTAVTGLYQNGVALPLGRYPNADEANKGNLTIVAHTDHYQIFSKEHLPSTIDWQGAEVVMRPTAWILDRAIVDHQYGDALNLLYSSTYAIRDNSEYFFQNHPATLDRNGEWYYNPSSKNILLYYNQGTPGNQLITATTFSQGIDMATSSYISLRNLHITQALHTNLLAQNVSNLTLTNLDITNAGEDGVTVLGYGNNILMENNKILAVNNNGILIDAYQTVTVTGNTIRSIGIVPGRGKSGDGHYNGLASQANQAVLIANNVIDSIGYNGITFSSNTTIQQNIISNYCFSKIDGGGIYTWNGNKTAMNNIHILSNILYTGPAGGNTWVDYAIGIYLDDCAENVEVRNNTVFGNTQWGVFLHGAYAITFTDNTLFDNRDCQFIVYHNGGACPIRNDVIKRNVIVSKLPSQLVARYESNANDLFQYGLIDSNYYARPFNDTATIQGIINYTTGGQYSLKDWQTFSGGLDLHSKSSPITYKQYKNEGAGGTTRINNTFDTGSEGWSVLYSAYTNADVSQDITNKLDGGSLRISFPNPSGKSDSYVQVVKSVALIKGKTYVLRFDAVASAPINMLLYLRQAGPPFKEYDRRYTPSIDTTRKSYELPFTVSDTDTNAIIMLQLNEIGSTVWLDNIRLQEDVPIQNNPDEFIRLFYNPTLKDSVITLTDIYRDVKNQSYSHSITLKPFASIVLFKDTLPVLPADLSLSLESDKRVLQVNEPVTFRIRVSNQSANQSGLARWTYRLPTNLQFISSGQPYSDNVLTGTISQLGPLADTTFAFMVKPTAAGLFRTSAQLTTATSPDPDSNPNSGTADGEDDAATVELRVNSLTTGLFESPNPNQRSLPAVASSQPAPNPNQADLSVRMIASRRTPGVGDLITYTIYITNAGGITATGVQLQDQLPDGLQLTNSANWQVNGTLLSATVAPIPANTTVSISFQGRITLPGVWLNKVQINTSNVPDPDSTPGNGFTNGEDDQAQVDVRSGVGG